MPNHIETIEIGSVVDLLSNLTEPPAHMQSFYRGHKRASYSLIPSLFRTEAKPHWQSYGNGLIQDFLRNIGRYLPSVPTDEYAIKALAQHHGVPTDLLDWSLSPLVALFFAVEDLEPKSEAEDAELWQCMGTGIKREAHPAFPTNYDIGGVGYFIPPFINPRMAAQQGCFTILVGSKAPEDGKDCKPLNSMMEHRPTVYKIPHEKRHELQKELNLLGINYSSIYPDLEGLGMHIAWCARNGIQ